MALEEALAGAFAGRTRPAGGSLSARAPPGLVVRRMLRLFPSSASSTSPRPCRRRRHCACARRCVSAGPPRCSIRPPPSSSGRLAQAMLFGAFWGCFADGDPRRGLVWCLLILVSRSLVNVSGTRCGSFSDDVKRPLSGRDAVEQQSASPPALELARSRPIAGGPTRSRRSPTGAARISAGRSSGEDVTWVVAYGRCEASKLLPEWKDFKARARKWYWGFPSTRLYPLSFRQ